MTKPAPAAGSTEHLNSAAVARLAKEAEAMGVRDPRRLAASLAMFERLSEHWSLRGDEREMLLGGIPKSTWSEWRQRPFAARIKSDTRERIANLFAIDLNAHSLFAPEFADTWVRQSNAAFRGQSPMSTMLNGKVEDIITVRRYLERVRSSSPSDLVGSGTAGSSDQMTVSYLPGDAVESHASAALPALRRAAEIYERLAATETVRYRPALAAALSALATCLEENNEAEAAPILRRALEIQSQVASERSAPIATIDELDASDGPWRTVILPRAANVVASIGMLVPSFNAALRAWVRETELQPFAYPAHSAHSDVHVSDMTHRGVTWTLSFIISDVQRRITVLSIEPGQAAQ